MMKKIILLTVLTAGLFACDNSHDDMYDPNWVREQYNNHWKMNIGEIDPNHTWNMAKQVKANLSIKEDALSEYTFKIYTANPLSNGNAKLLAYAQTTTDASGEGLADVHFDVLDGVKYVWVSRVDSHKRRLVKMAIIENGQLNVSFGSLVSSRSLSSRSSAEVDALPYTTKQLNEWMASGCDLSVGDIPNIAVAEGVYYVPANTNMDWNFAANGDGYIASTDRGRVKLIVAGTLNLKDDIALSCGVEVIVANGGTLNLEAEMKFTNNSGLIVMPEAKLNAPGHSIEFTNGSGWDGRNYGNYIAGDVNVGSWNNNGGATYNCGNNVYIGTLCGSSESSAFINNGNTVIGTVSSILCLENNCKLVVEGDANINKLITGPNSYIRVNGKMSLHANGDSQISVLGDNSILDVNIASFDYPRLEGPINEYALIRVNEVESYGFNYSDWNQGVFVGGIINNVYLQINSEYTVPEIVYGWEAYGASNAAKMVLSLNNSEAKIGTGNAVLVTNNEAPLSIPSGDCTEGNEPVDEGGDSIIEEDTPQSWTIACEDLGSIGDFDFNDVVFRVSHVSGSSTATVTPLAAGGTMAVNLYYGSNLIGEIHDLLASGADVTKMINTGLEGEKGYSVSSLTPIEINVDDSFSMTSNMGNFNLKVVNGNGVETTKISGYTDTGNSPQMICVPGDWRWPREWQSIKSAYPEFGDWSADGNYSTWYTNSKSEYLY